MDNWQQIATQYESIPDVGANEDDEEWNRGVRVRSNVDGRTSPMILHENDVI